MTVKRFYIFYSVVKYALENSSLVDLFVIKELLVIEGVSFKREASNVTISVQINLGNPLTRADTLATI
jgi:hypothetical protein